MRATDAVLDATKVVLEGPRGLPTRRELTNGAVTARSYDVMQRLEQLDTTAQGASIQALAYRRDLLGNIVEIEELGVLAG